MTTDDGTAGPMITKSIFDMKFVTPRQPVPTVELNMDSQPQNTGGYSATVIGALADFARNNPKARATIYVYQGVSVNFHKHTFSAFFGVAATQKIQEKVLRILYSAFRKIPDVEVRESDYIDHQDGLMEFHIEDGCVWEAVDATAWYTNCGDSNEEVAQEDETRARDPEAKNQDEDAERSKPARVSAHDISAAVIERILDVAGREGISTAELNDIVAAQHGAVNCYPGNPSSDCHDIAYFFSLRGQLAKGNDHQTLDQTIKSLLMHTRKCVDSRYVIIMTDAWDHRHHDYVLRDLIEWLETKGTSVVIYLVGTGGLAAILYRTT